MMDYADPYTPDYERDYEEEADARRIVIDEASQHATDWLSPEWWRVGSPAFLTWIWEG